MSQTLRYLFVGCSCVTLLTACIFSVETDMASIDEADAGDADLSDTNGDFPDADDEPFDADTGNLDADTSTPDPDDADTDSPDADTGPGDTDTGPGDTDTTPDATDADPDDADTDPPPEPSIEIIDADSEIHVDKDDDGDFTFSVEYEFQCEPDGCEEHLLCRVSQAGAEVLSEPCNLTFELTDEDVSDGIHTLEVELRDQEGDTVEASDEQITTIYFNFEASIDLEDDSEFSHPYLGTRLVSCTHPDCAVACQWDNDDLSPVDDPGICDLWESPDFEHDFELPEAVENTTLYFKACSTNDFGDNEHCVEEAYNFEYVEPVWQQVSAGHRHTCAILDDQSLWCWGADEVEGPNGEVQGILGAGEGLEATEYQPLHVRTDDEPTPRWKSVASGFTHTCAISEHDELYCWGFNSDGEVAPGISETSYPTPTLVDDQHSWHTVSSGAFASCAITDEDELYCWGATDYRLGSGDDPDLDDLNLVTTEVQIGAGGSDEIEGWLDVDLGFEHGCALAENSSLDVEPIGTVLAYCWGRSTDGQVGSSSEGPHLTPVLVYEDESEPTEQFTTRTLLEVTTGYYHSCAMAEDENNDIQAYCWGHDGNSRLARSDAAPEDTHLPGLVEASAGFATISAGSRHTCAIDDDLEPTCWGANSQGQTGNSTELNGDTDTPTTVDFTEFGDQTFQSISAGGDHTCAISDDSDDNTLYCWGDNTFGAVGVPESEPEEILTPVRIEWPHAP